MKIMLGLKRKICLCNLWIKNCFFAFVVEICQQPFTNNKKTYLENLKKNWYFPISAFAFFLLFLFSSHHPIQYGIAVVVAVLFSCIVACQIPSVITQLKSTPKALLIFCIISSASTCIEASYIFYNEALLSSKMQLVKAMLPRYTAECGIIFLGISAFFFVWFFTNLFWRKVKDIIRNTQLFKDIKVIEIIIYSSIAILSIAFVSYCYINSNVFYSSHNLFGGIYRADSSALFKNNVFVNLAHPENDIRQPLFAIFSIPFMSIPCAISSILNLSISVKAILINATHIVLLIFTNYILARAMKLTALKRIFFMILISSTYTQLFFTLIIEQYIIAYFWLIFCVYSTINKGKNFAFYGAVSTLIPSASLLLAPPYNLSESSLKDRILHILKICFTFVFIMMMFGRLDIFLNVFNQFMNISVFTDASLAFNNKIPQYIDFVSLCPT